MEIEMKQQLNDVQLETLLNQNKWKDCKKEFVIKKDIYYSFNGEMLTNPKKVVRVRRNDLVFALDPQKYEYGLQDTSSFVKNKFFNFDIQHSAAESSVDLTIKSKSTNSSGIETNIEKECKIGEDDFVIIEELLKTANFYPYFKKEKRSIGWYVILEGFNLHLEVVSVNGCTPYLEVEVILVDNYGSESEKKEWVETAQNVIKKFFKENLNITDFDGRSWNQIINQS